MNDNHPLVVKDVNLNPGEFCFGSWHYRIRTLLGSCVALILWHPEKKIGGMSHVILPEKRLYQSKDEGLVGKFADESFELFKKSARLYKTDISEYIAKLFGGAHMLTDKAQKDFYVSDEEKAILEGIQERFNIGKKNSTFIKQMLADSSIPVISEDLGGNRHRKVFFTVWDGEVWMEKTK